MPYYCTECEKEHANNYKKHWKYKKQVLVTRKKQPDLFSKIEADFEAFKEKMEKYCEDVEKIKQTIGMWSVYIDRKHPYWKSDKDWWDWINDT